MRKREFEQRVQECYSTWGVSYYEDYLGKNAPYPPVHNALLKRLLKQASAKSVLDAGCGPASFLRELNGKKVDLYGFDLTPEMVVEAKRVFRKKGWDPEKIWQGSVLEPSHYRASKKKFDAAVCIGVLPHIPPKHDLTVIKNLKNAVKRGGLVAIEARNQLFALFTLNRYSYEFFLHDLIKNKKLRQVASHTLAAHFRRDLPPTRQGKQGEPGYDEILSRTHNPLILREQMTQAGFRHIRLLFYHFHGLPPLYGNLAPKLFRQESLALEKTPEDWRGYFMASAFIIIGKKV